MESRERSPWFIHLIFVLIACATILPLILVFMVSITDETTIIRDGYSFFPNKISFSAYRYLFLDSMTIVRAYGVTIFVTVVGTLIGLFITALLAYPISRRDFPYRKGLSFFIFFTILFNGGLVPWYLVFTQLLNVKDNIWSLILPGLLLNGFFVLIMRTFFETSVPSEVIESA
jgi:putative aldouronate transport system permease protein